MLRIYSNKKEVIVSALRRALKRTTLPVLIVLCLAALTASYAYADGALRPLAT